MLIKTLALLASVGAAVLVPAVAAADTITLSAHSGSNYTFDAYASDGNLSFGYGNTIALSGLSGVTNVALTSTAAAFGMVSYNANSLIFTVKTPATGSSTSLLDVPLFTVTSTASNLSNIAYSMQENCTTFSGIVQNSSPTATTPEPCSLFLLSTGAAAAGLLRRRRRDFDASAEVGGIQTVTA